MPGKGKPFKKGEATGRPKGVQNKITRTVKETVWAAFNELQCDPKHNIVAFAKSNPKEFYAIAAKLIPTEVKATVGSSVPILSLDPLADATDNGTS